MLRRFRRATTTAKVRFVKRGSRRKDGKYDKIEADSKIGSSEDDLDNRQLTGTGEKVKTVKVKQKKHKRLTRTGSQVEKAEHSFAKYSDEPSPDYDDYAVEFELGNDSSPSTKSDSAVCGPSRRQTKTRDIFKGLHTAHIQKGHGRRESNTELIRNATCSSFDDDYFRFNRRCSVISVEENSDRFHDNENNVDQDKDVELYYSSREHKPTITEQKRQSKKRVPKLLRQISCLSDQSSYK